MAKTLEALHGSASVPQKALKARTLSDEDINEMLKALDENEKDEEH